MKPVLVFLSLLLVGVIAVSARAPLLFVEKAEDRIASSYIVVFHPYVSVANLHAHADHVATKSGEVLNVFNIGTFKALGGKLSPEFLDFFRSLPSVNYVEEDRVVSALDCDSQNNAVWGLNRVVQQETFNLDGVYTYNSDAGSKTTVYTVDTGILLTHQEFVGRAVWGKNFVGDNKDTDCNGHGTHVTGTIGGITYGLAKDVQFIAVKVLGCGGSGTLNGFISGIQYVTDDYTAQPKPSVANLSLGFSGKVASATQAVEQSIAAGINYAIAAGNSYGDACSYSPADSPSGNIVGATELVTLSQGALGDRRAGFSNYGQCVKIFAPGVNITSSWIGSNTATKTISGTSMATPHVAGAIALYLSLNPTATTSNVSSWLKAQATNGVINLNCFNSACQQSPNALLYSPCS